MRIDLDVPAGTIMLFGPNEWYPRPGVAAQDDVLVSAVAVYREAIGGLVLAHGHVCNLRHPDCGGRYCWEAQVSVAAVRAIVAGAR